MAKEGKRFSAVSLAEGNKALIKRALGCKGGTALQQYCSSPPGRAFFQDSGYTAFTLLRTGSG